MNFTGENLLRELTPQVLGAVVRRFGDFSAAEDAVQETLLAAAMQWPEKSVPDNPRGWLIQVAARRMTDHLRAELARRRREVVVAMQMPPDQVAPAVDSEDDTDQDDTLILLFMCSLTLRAIGGLTTAEIANAYLVPETTMAQRISRAKQRIKTSGVRFRMPSDRERAERLGAVLHVLYLTFNEGYASSIGAHLQRTDLSNEAIRLARVVQLQAAIAAVHNEATRPQDTDWPQILALYGLLKRMTDNPMVTLNHAIAAAMVHGPSTGLELLEALDADERLAGHYRLHAVRAHLLEMTRDHEAAIAHYRAAADRTTSIPERDYLTTQAARLSAERQQRQVPPG